MTIFDIQPYSFWSDLHRSAHHAWVHLGRDTPRSVCELTLLREVNRRLLIDNRRLAADLAETAARLSAEQRYRQRGVLHRNERILAALNLLNAAMEDDRRLVADLTRIEPSETPPCNVSPLARANTPASGETCEIGGVACATMNGGDNV